MKQIIKDFLAAILKDIGVPDAGIAVEVPENPQHGDYTTNVAMLLASRLKAQPAKIAQQIVDAIIKYQKESGAGKLEWLAKAEVAPPGFVNLWLSEAYFGTELAEVLEKKEGYGSSKKEEFPAENQAQKVGASQKSNSVSFRLPPLPPLSPEKAPENRKSAGKPAKNGPVASFGKRVVVEYTDPNPFKEFHIGHLISNVTGEAIARLKEAEGTVVWRADYFGDVGIHVAKSVWGLQKKLEEDNLTILDLAKKDLAERVNYMGQAYAMGTKAYEADDKVKAGIAKLNTVLYIAAQQMWQKEGKKPRIDYDPEKKVTKEEIDKIYDLYVTGRKWSLEYFETIYKRLGTKFDGYYPESFVGEIGYEFVTENIGKVFEKSEGAVIFPGEKFGLHTRVFINKHNLPTYEAKELGLAPAKYQDFPYDESIIVVGKEIKEYFAVLVEALTQINPQLGHATRPLFTGMVNLPQGKMSSRHGNVVTVIGLIDKLKDMVLTKIESFDYPKDVKEEIAEKVAIAALKYSMLRVSVPSDIAFDFEASLSFDGDSGPYLLYSYARAKSVLRKASPLGPLGPVGPLNPEERAIARRIAQFPDVVAEAARNFTPNTLATYLFHLAQEFNLFYAKHGILGDAQRLALTAVTAQVLKNGLYLLGIPVVERM